MFTSVICFGESFNKAYFKNNLQLASYAIDTEASAVILYEHTSVDIVFANRHEQQTLTVRRIIRVLKSDALNLANVSVVYPSDNINNYVYDLQGITYNLKGDKLEETELPKEDHFKEDNGNNLYVIKFLMPAVKEGSIIDYTYKVVSVAQNQLPIWFIQGNYPKLTSEFELYYPANYAITTISHTHLTPKEYGSIADLENSTNDFSHFIHAGATKYTNSTSYWVRKNIAGIKKDEPYVNNVNKEMERIENLVTGFTSAYGNSNFMNSWDKANDFIMKTLGIEKQINDPNPFLDVVVDSIKKADTSQVDITRSIYMYVRNNYECAQFNLGNIKNLYDVYDKKKGDVLSLNLLLSAMLVRAGIHASIMLISTTNNIPFNPSFPVLGRLDYVACAVTFRDSTQIYLDASDKNNCYGLLPPKCYNGFAWVLGDPGHGTQLTSEMLTDKTVQGIKISNFTDSSAQLEIKEKLGLQQSIATRKKHAKDDKALRTFYKENAQKFPSNISISECTVENEENPDTNLVITYTGTMHFDNTNNAVYLNTSLLPLLKENPFKAATRELPIEFPYISENKYFMTLMLPETYQPDSLPEPLGFDFEKGSIEYKRVYSYSPQAHILTISSNYNINKIAYPSEYYESIRELFGKILPLNNEIITLKKPITK